MTPSTSGAVAPSSPPPPSAALVPAGPPVTRTGSCRVAQPRLSHPQVTPRFRFQQATLLLLLSGELQLGTDPAHRVSSGPALLAVEAGTTVDLTKLPGPPEGCFRSLFLEVAAPLLAAARREHPTALAVAAGQVRPDGSGPARRVELDDDLRTTLAHVARSVTDDGLSDARVHHRLLDLLLALAERGCSFAAPAEQTTSDRVRQLVSDAPERRWTAAEVGRVLSISEATLRRRLAREGTAFDELVVDVRMHHAVMLLQTTGWSLSHVAQACGYLSRSRFSERFRQRFGTSPVAVR